MRLLLDQNLPQLLEDLLTDAGHSVVHVPTIGLGRASDKDVLALAAEQGQWWCRPTPTSVSCSPYPTQRSPSVLLLRRQQGRRAAQLAALLLANLGDAADDLAEGSIVVLDERRIRVRRLPLRPDT